MASSGSWRPRVAEALGSLRGARALGGSVHRVTAGGRVVVVKADHGALDEAEGLRRLGGTPGAPPVPEVLLAEPGLLVTTWVEQGTRTPAHEEVLGRTLAGLHAAPCPVWGGGSSWVGTCRVDPSVAPDAASFYRGRITGLARRCGLERAVEPLADRLDELLPPGGPAPLHGDLWWGNVLWGAEGRAWLIDPSVHGGHPEEDLAMLGLFGVVPGRLLGAYAEVRPLAPGREEREPLFQLCPLLVHAVLFGGGYRARAEDVARRLA